MDTARKKRNKHRRPTQTADGADLCEIGEILLAVRPHKRLIWDRPASCVRRGTSSRFSYARPRTRSRPSTSRCSMKLASAGRPSCCPATMKQWAPGSSGATLGATGGANDLFCDGPPRCAGDVCNRVVTGSKLAGFCDSPSYRGPPLAPLIIIRVEGITSERSAV
jgi:hypothetical protein